MIRRDVSILVERNESCSFIMLDNSFDSHTHLHTHTHLHSHTHTPPHTITGMMMFMKQADRDRKQAARVERKIPLDMRTPLTALKPGTSLSGIVISLTNFGAYIDIGTECDGLLHISQISNSYFVEHPKYVMEPGDQIDVTIKSLNPELKKLHLTMLDPEDEEEDDDDERIVLEDVEVDDELWGEIVRVTDYGSYVELGAEVKGFLHFMDHPFFGNEPGAHPSTYMEVGQRVRAWVSDVDRERNRIKLTAMRPGHLPGPRRELF
jgi:ribosomal protein S1